MHPYSPHSFKNRLLHTLPVLLIGILASSSLALVVSASDMTPPEVVKLANESRVEAGLSPLALNTALSKAAYDKAQDMIKNDYFAHTSPSGVTPWDWIKKEGYAYDSAGENLAVNYTSAAAQHAAWMKSASHRANIMNPSYQEIGVAVVEGKVNGKNSLITVEYFGTPQGGAAAAREDSGAFGKVPAVKGAETAVQTGPGLVSDMNSKATTAVNFPSHIFESIGALSQAHFNLAWLFALALLALAVILTPIAFLSEVVHSLESLRREKKTKRALALAPAGALSPPRS